MKYAISFILLLSVFSLQSLQAATSAATSVIEESLFSSINENIFESSEIIGIGRIAKIVRAKSPIRTLNALTQTSGSGRGGSGTRMGERLFTLMNQGMQSGQTMISVEVDPTLAVSTEIIGGDAGIDAISVQGGRMYPPRLVVDFQKFPVPTYAAMPSDVQQKRMTKLNEQLQRRFGETVQVDYQENVHYLRGTVVSNQQKEILELFIKMEPGIQEVRNEVVIRE
ncbi:MAG: hypothetical protein FWC43_06095 [Planctomycetaceae bacterium]|nr:hypothetical protein [Planctomycetaceae bacterium]